MTNAETKMENMRAEKRITEEEPAKKERHLLEMQSLARLGSWELDLKRGNLVWSDELCRMFGFEPGNYPKSYKDFLALIHPDDRDLFRNTVYNTTKQKSRFSLYHRIAKNHEINTLYANMDVIVDNAGNAIAVFGTEQDVTELKRIEHELRKSKVELERRVAERTKELSSANRKLMNSLREKEILLNEIHHRVKNNLQIISSLMNLQFKENVPKSVLTNMQNRLKAMAIVHEKLYSKNLDNIHFSDYAKGLCNHTFRSFVQSSSNIALDLKIKNCGMDISKATSIGLIINEILSNAIEHGFPDNKAGRISINFQKEGKNYILEISNSGVKPKKRIDIENITSLGLTLVRSLVKQLNGTISVDTKDEVKFTVTIPENG